MSNKIILDEKVSDTSSYVISVKDDKGVIAFNGFLPYEGMQKFLTGYNELKKSVNPSTADLVLDAAKLNTFPKELEDKLGDLYCDYVKTFKKVYIVTPSNVITKMQLQRVLRAKNIFEKITFVDSASAVK